MHRSHATQQLQVRRVERAQGSRRGAKKHLHCTISGNRNLFPSSEAGYKLFYLAIKNISKKWTMPIQNWPAALNRFSIEFEHRMPNNNQPYDIS
jgi:hypothetical protein